MNQSSQEIPYSNSLESHWALIDRSRSVMAKRIESLAATLSGPRQRQLRSVGRWLKGSQNYEAALERPDVLYFCQAWLEASLGKPNDEPLNETEMIAAIGKGYCKFEASAPAPRNLTPFLYPMLALFVWLSIVAFGSVFVVAEFRNMYDEFGIELPLATERVMGIGSWFEANWRWFFALLVLLPIAFLISLRFSQRGRPYSLSWFDRRFSRFRIQLSVLASHVASLLAVGVGETEAIKIAGQCSSNQRLRMNCKQFSSGSQKYLIEPEKYPLINNSLSLKNRAAKIAILEETGRYYRSVGQAVQGWWLAWISKAIIVLIVFTVFFVATSLYMPMFSIVSGLT